MQATAAVAYPDGYPRGHGNSAGDTNANNSLGHANGDCDGDGFTANPDSVVNGNADEFFHSFRNAIGDWDGEASNGNANPVADGNEDANRNAYAHGDAGPTAPVTNADGDCDLDQHSHDHADADANEDTRATLGYSDADADSACECDTDTNHPGPYLDPDGHGCAFEHADWQSEPDGYRAAQRNTDDHTDAHASAAERDAGAAGQPDTDGEPAR